jgi:hypothetical protein
MTVAVTSISLDHGLVTGLTMADVAAGAGTVTSVGLGLPGEFSVSGSPVTGSGTLAGAWVSQAANKVFAAPDGSAGTPSFRLLVAADIPAVAESQVTGLVADLAAKAPLAMTWMGY